MFYKGSKVELSSFIYLFEAPRKIEFVVLDVRSWVSV